METLSKREEEQLKDVLDEFAYLTTAETGVRYISGGFAIAEYESCDENWIYITLKWGTQNDVDNDVHVENWKLERYFLTLPITVAQKLIGIKSNN